MRTKSTHTKQNRHHDYVPGSSRGSRRATTLLAELQAQIEAVTGGQALDDIERGRRIKERREDLHLTQPAVVELMEQAAWKLPVTHDLHPARAGKAPITLRGLQTYEGGGGIVWEKSKLLAQVLQMDVQVMLNGERRDEAREPELPIRRESGEDRLARMEQEITGLIAAVSDVITEAREVIDDFKTYRSEISGQLTGQTGILERIEAKLGQDEQSADRIEAASAGFDAKFDAAVARASEGLRSDPERPLPAAPKTSRKRTPAA